MIWFVLALAWPLAPVTANEQLNWAPWRELPVQNGGRRKPLDTLARETLRSIAIRGSHAEQNAGRSRDPVELYVTLLFQWRGWDHPQREQLQRLTDWRPMYGHLHSADAWDQAPLLEIEHSPLRAALGLPKDQNRVSPWQLLQSRISPQRGQRAIPFSAWAEERLLQSQAGKPLSELEQKGVELAHRLWAYQDLRMGRGLEVLPVPNSDRQEWAPLGLLLIANLDDASDPTGELRRAQQQFWRARAAFEKQDAAAFEQSSREFVAAVRRFGEADSGYPRAALIGWELAYNRWKPFRIAWGMMLLAAVLLSLRLVADKSILSPAAWAAYGLGLAALAAGMALRTLIAGRPPLTNMYETVVFVGAGGALFGLLFECLSRRQHALLAASVVAAVALSLAECSPVVLDSSLRPLAPVLRSNFWLIAHVMTVSLAYAAFALALGVANFTLGCFLFRSAQPARTAEWSRLTCRAIRAGVLLLSLGIVLGAAWADLSWGRFWDWDPKEVWALLALLGYLAVLQARHAGWLTDRDLAAATVVCFWLVIMGWYGVNFVLGAGRHTYGFGSGGQGLVFGAVALQFLFASAALLRSMTAPAGESTGPTAGWTAVLK